MTINSNNSPLDQVITEDFGKLFEEYAKTEKQEKQIVSGVIVSITKDSVIVDVGLKSEGVIPLAEFAKAELETLEVGQEIDVYLEKLEGKRGKTILSREKATRELSWKNFHENFHKDVEVVGTIMGRVKGGFAVELDGGVIAFLPGSQVDVKPIRDMTSLFNMPQSFKVLKIDKENGNVVVSRRVILENARQKERDEMLSDVKEGSILRGVVKNITDYGAFIDLGCIDGLLHITDISWKKVKHPSEVLTVGEEMEFVVINYNKESRRVSLGLKQLQKNPWESFEERYKVGTKTKGIVTSLIEYGALVQLEPNVEGLVYHTEISWNAKNIAMRNKLLKVGDEVEVLVLDINIAKHRISLSIKQCKENPWADFISLHPVGTIVSGVVKNITDFGLFITVNENDPDKCIDILVPAVELTWDSNNIDEVLKGYKKGDVVEGVILSSDIERERIIVSVKQLAGNNILDKVDQLVQSGIVTCTVSSIKKDGIEVQVEDNINGFIKKSELSKHKNEQKIEKFAVGDRVDAKVLSFDKHASLLVLSIKALEIDEEKKVIAEFGSADSGASLGDILGAALSKKD